MTGEDFNEAFQTAVLAVVAMALIYALYLLRRELRQAGAVLRQVLETQTQLQQNVRRVWERIDALEARHGIQGDANTFMRMKRLLDALEQGPPPGPPGPSP
jgi:Tfp pilus assembly protein PilN